MKLTSALKTLLQSKGVKPDATEQEMKKAAYGFLADDATHPGFDAEFTKSQEDDSAKGGNTLLSLLEKVNQRLDSLEGVKPSDGLKKDAPRMPEGVEKEFAINKPEDQPRIKRAVEQYNSSTKALVVPQTGRFRNPHPNAGKELRLQYHKSNYDGGGDHVVEEPSELHRALSGAYMKFLLTRNGTKFIHPRLAYTDHDRDLMHYAMSECKWVGVLGCGVADDAGTDTVDGSVGLKGQKLSPKMQKALLDDSTSGGLEAVPIFFDDMLITTPLLHTEFFPKVQLVTVNRGRRIEGATMSNVTVTSSTEGTAITLFTTTSFIGAFDTTIFVASGAIHIGLDFLGDSPINIADEVVKSYNEAFLAWLDNQIIGGDGTTEPEGILNASGTVTVGSTNTSGGPWTVGDVEEMLFGVSKAYKGGTPPDRIGWGSTEATYRNIRAIAVSTTDARRIFGMSHEDYRLMDRFFGIGSSGSGGFTSNRQLIFANFNRYRMYRRAGLGVRNTQEGDTLVRANTLLIVARARFGGQLTDGNAAAVCTDGMS